MWECFVGVCIDTGFHNSVFLLFAIFCSDLHQLQKEVYCWGVITTPNFWFKDYGMIVVGLISSYMTSFVLSIWLSFQYQWFVFKIYMYIIYVYHMYIHTYICFVPVYSLTHLIGWKKKTGNLCSYCSLNAIIYWSALDNLE